MANIAWLRRGRSEGSGNSHVKIGSSWNASASTSAIGPTSSTVATLSSSVIASPSCPSPVYMTDLDSCSIRGHRGGTDE